MIVFILVIVLISLLFIYIAFWQKPTQQEFKISSENRPYLSKKPLTATEAKFYHLLAQALPDHEVLAQVQISSFLKVDNAKIKQTDSYRWFNQIAQQSVDYLICTKDFSVVAAIELDDKSHTKAEAIARDIKKTNNLAAAKVPLIRWHAEVMPELEVIKQTILRFSIASEDHQLQSNEWLYRDEKEQFFNRSKNQSTSFPLPIFMAAIVIVFLIFGKSLVANILSTPFSQQSKAQSAIKRQLHDSQLQAPPNNALQKSMKKQQQQKFSQNREAVLKEEAWKRYDNNSVDCTTESDIAKCGNEYIAKRRKFEQLWEAQKNRK